MSVDCALAVANEAAVANGAGPADSLVSISEMPSAASRVRRVNYGPRDFVARRGMDGRCDAAQRVIRGR